MLKIPEEGLDHKVFRKFLPNHTLELVLTLDTYVDQQVGKMLEEIIKLWVGNTDWQSFGTHHANAPKFFVEAKDNVLHLGVALVANVADPAKQLLEMLAKSPVQVLEMLAVKRELLANGKMGAVVETEEALQQKIYKHPGHWWQASFDWQMQAPVSIFPGLLSTNSYHNIPRVKTMRLHLDGCRIAYGLCIPKTFSPNKHTHNLAQYLQALMEEEFQGPLPKIGSNRLPKQKVSLISHQNRQGYAFSIAAAPLEVHYPHGIRYREYELMLCLRKLIGELNLAPVIHWKRTANAFQLHLWENWTYHRQALK